MKKIKRIPKFKSAEEEAKFWDTHDTMDYPDEFVDVEEPIEISPALIEKVLKANQGRKQLLTLRMTPKQIEIARKIAATRGCGYQTQIRMWVVAGIVKEIKENPELEKILAKKK
jgi:predicted DNA binding CopG/RHH family protein